MIASNNLIYVIGEHYSDGNSRRYLNAINKKSGNIVWKKKLNRSRSNYFVYESGKLFVNGATGLLIFGNRE